MKFYLFVYSNFFKLYKQFKLVKKPYLTQTFYLPEF